MYRSEDTKAILLTAERLGMSEFEVFSAAYRAWFHERAATASLERYFVAYLFNGRAPFWVRHFTRSTLLEEPASEGPVARGTVNACAEIVDFIQLALQLTARRPPRPRLLAHTHRLLA
ncbi:MAG: hypothetical protein GWN84_22960 [Gammaproteobacteria bacterium]|nr:hypothetical protein [Gammaproteobacteria bacterium]NIR85470.1 hypothetical protein [Gammaproteobacteria bacterium]NIR89522.1 hypothetical protein [Gammaproteobacteria bacterium]NIU06607.1 hypothetical protein [Gammaproteobacteria bacterium]NIV53490.1 hypothetical protein [Gammaproteobacteria bacterium]